MLAVLLALLYLYIRVMTDLSHVYVVDMLRVCNLSAIAEEKYSTVSIDKIMCGLGKILLIP